MADRWLDIGWTVQSPPSFFAEIQSAPWKIPADVDVVNVWSEYHSLDGGRTTGYVTFAINEAPLLHVASRANLMTASWSAVIDHNGRVNVNLPATDTLAISPSPFTYTMTVVLNYKFSKTFTCILPKGTPSININQISPYVVPVVPMAGAVISGGSA